MSLSYKIKYLLFSLAAVAVSLSSCKDDLEFPEFGDGEALVKCEVKFTPLVSALSSRAPGNAIKTIDNLHVLIYNSDDLLIADYTKDDLLNYQSSADENSSLTPNTGLPSGNIGSGSHNNPNKNPEKAEEETPRVTFSIPSLPFGSYKFYAVANLTAAQWADIKAMDGGIENIENIKNYSLTWNYGDIPANNAMFGYFTTEDRKDGADKFDAPSIPINKNVSEIYAWIKRAASKVTIAFDGSNLKNNVWIYVKSVTLKNIPKSCKLGAENSPNQSADFYNAKESLLLSHQPDDYSEPTPIENSQLLYCIDNTEPSDNSGDPASLTTQPAASYENKGYETWMRIANGLGNENGLLGSTHSENANALYFFENNQGDFKDQERYYKPQQWAQVGTNITQPGQPDYRDDVENGTYIEVEAYYVSDNEENPSRGPIRYRFMLGKDITYNYDAERNHHFKLTLGFNGWANQPDWHIEYEEPDPALVLPETFYVSYLYNQTHTLPIKLVGDCEELTMEIINNDWAPYINEETLAGTYSYTNPINNPYAFRWANQIFSWQQQNQEKTNYPYGLYNATGFLALQTDMASDGLPPKNVVSDMKHGDGKSAVVELYDLYAGNKADPNTGNIVNQAFRHFSATDLDEGDHPAATNSWNDWNVKVIDDQTKVLHVPLWTRNKTMIYGTNYSGNNPFEAYQRIAKVKVTAKFKNGEEKVETLTVKQAQRIVNPKGVWRANHLEGDDKNFHVTLMVKAIPTDLQDAERANFTPLVSDGSWEAFIEQGETDFFTLEVPTKFDTDGNPLLDADGNQITYEPTKVTKEGDKILGKTSSPVNFRISFNGDIDAAASKFALVRVNYNGNNCVHKILVRQGFNEPIRIIDTAEDSEGNQVIPALWSSFSVFGATPRAGETNSYDVELTNSPLALGSYVRRGRVDKAILIENNSKANLGPYQDPGTTTFKIYDKDDNNPNLTWAEVGCSLVNVPANNAQQIKERDDYLKANAGDMGRYHTIVNDVARLCKVPSFEDYYIFDKYCEFGFGIFYGPGCSNTKIDFYEATSYFNEENSDAASRQDKGMRGVTVYNRYDARHIFFPIGRYGIGRRQQNVWNFSQGQYAGTLWYGDVNIVLNTTSQTSGNFWRPMAWNVGFQPGGIYWIDQYVSIDDVQKKTGNNSLTEGCMGWDMNYYGFDFSLFSWNNYLDGCPMKLVIVEDQNN